MKRSVQIMHKKFFHDDDVIDDVIYSYLWLHICMCSYRWLCAELRQFQC